NLITAASTYVRREKTLPRRTFRQHSRSTWAPTSHLLAAIPSQGAAQLLKHFAQVFAERGYHDRGVLAGDPEKHRKASMTLDERGDVCVVRARDEDLLPSGLARRDPRPRPAARGWKPHRRSVPVRSSWCRPWLGASAALYATTASSSPMSISRASR